LSSSLLEKVYKVISEVFVSNVDVPTERPKYEHYPYTTAWVGHNDAISSILNSNESFLASPTGSGKTAVYLTASVVSELKTLVVVPRNGLQKQVADYEKRMGVPILYLFERSKMCNKKKSDKDPAPCLKKFRKGGKWYFKLGEEVVEYPCTDCPYEAKKETIRELFRNNECIAVLNQGNFWLLRSQAEFVIIDEADETLRSITDAVSYPRKFESDDPVEVLRWMASQINKDIEKVTSALEVTRKDSELEKLNIILHKLERRLRKIEFFMEYPPDKLITYIRGNKTYVEVFDNSINIVRKLFSDAKVCMVTATPPISNGTQPIEYVLPFRAKVIYAPLGNMSERNVFRRGNTELLEKAVDFIIKTYDYTVNLTGMKKAPVHCGNLSKHGLRVYELFKANGRKALLMEEGKQNVYVEEFIKGDYDFFCAVAVEYGYDWGFSPIQYILKVPFADLKDPRLEAIRKQLGQEKFDEWYGWDALSRLIQACGRNARTPNDFGITIILDSCFGWLYNRFKDKIPKWFKERLVWLAGDSNGKS